MQKSVIAGVVVLFEPSEEQLKNIYRYSEIVDKFFIIDNSTNDHYSLLGNIFKKTIYRYDVNNTSGNIFYFHCESNIGLCAAFNLGMNAARHVGCKWTLLMDDDSFCETNIVDVYKLHIHKKNIAVLAPVHLHDRSCAHSYEGTRKIEWAMTSGCLYNNEIFDKVGGFMEELFVDGLDMDYCYRVHEKGYNVFECGQAIVHHHPAQTRVLKFFGFTFLKYGYSSPKRYYMQCRGLIWTFLRYRHVRDLVTYAWKWIKAIFFFEEKKDFIIKMMQGSKDGLSLYKKYRGVK